MPENDKTDTEGEYFSLHCAQDSQKARRKKLERLYENPV